MDAFDELESYEWTGVIPEPLEPCGRVYWDGVRDRVCLSTVGELRKRFNHRGFGLFCGDGHMRPEQYVSHSDLTPGGRYGSAGVPSHYLSNSALRKRGNEYQIKDAVRLRAHNARRCLWCETEPAPSSRRQQFRWLRINDRALFEQVVYSLGDAVVARTDVDDIWFDALPSNLKADVQGRFDDSRLQADHYAAKELAAPSCGPCNRGRKAFLLTSEDRLEEKVVSYFFKTRSAAASSPKFLMFQEALVQCINAINRLERRKASGD